MAVTQDVRASHRSELITSRNVSTNQPRFWQPGLFFKYELEPYVMTYGWQSRSLIEMLLRCVATSMCMLGVSLPDFLRVAVGGIYVVAGWVSSLLYYVQKKRAK